VTLEPWARTPGRKSAIRWQLSRPVRAAATAWMLPRGRWFIGRIARRVAGDIVLPGSMISASTPGGGSVEFDPDTMLGRIVWSVGSFEKTELSVAHRLATPGTHVFDVGANVGLFTVTLSRAVGPNGRVIAIEQLASTVLALRRNLERNGCMNVDVVQGAAAASPGEIPLMVTDDPALHSAGGQLIRGRSVVETVNVRAYTLDELWIEAGRPPVSLAKIDVEGGEYGVLLGSAQMIAQCRPRLILEVNDREQLPKITELLRDYRVDPDAGFHGWNHLMVPD
jgi:FkbM family methyltransferase